MRIEQQILLDAVHEIPIGGDKFSEFELINELKSPPWEIFPENALNNNLALFQYHFVLFHCLYKLQQKWLSASEGFLKITALHIQLMSLKERNLEDPAESKIRDYYLDWQNFQNTSEKDVEGLLDSFWQEFGAIGGWLAPSQQEITGAFEYFGLSDQSDWKQVKKAWLKAQSKSHPDKGGDAEQAKENARQFDVLKRYFKQFSRY